MFQAFRFTVASLLLAGSVAGAAHASTYTVDDFNELPGVSLTNNRTTTAVTSVTKNSGPVVIGNGATRNMRLVSTFSGSAVPTRLGRVDSGSEILDIANDAQVRSVVTITYANLPVDISFASVTDGVLEFQVESNDLPGQLLQVFSDLALPPLFSTVLPVVNDGDPLALIDFNLNASQLNDIVGASGNHRFAFRVTTVNNGDLAIGLVGIRAPEPGSIALLGAGLGLVAFGIRRKRA